jgi:hypothetical protein
MYEPWSGTFAGKGMPHNAERLWREDGRLAVYTTS